MKSMSISWISVGVIQEVKQCHQQTSSLAFLSYSLYFGVILKQHDDKKAAGSFGLMTGMSNAANIWLKKKYNNNNNKIKLYLSCDHLYR